MAFVPFSLAWVSQTLSSFRGAGEAREPGIHDACAARSIPGPALRAGPGMTRAWRLGCTVHPGPCVEFCKPPCLYAAPTRAGGLAFALDRRQRHQHSLRACRRWPVGRAAARDGRHAHELGWRIPGADIAVPHPALRPARLRPDREGAQHHHRALDRRPRGDADRHGSAAALPLRHGRGRHHADIALHDEASRPDRKLHVLQPVHRRRSEPRGGAQ